MSPIKKAASPSISIQRSSLPSLPSLSIATGASCISSFSATDIIRKASTFFYIFDFLTLHKNEFLLSLKSF